MSKKLLFIISGLLVALLIVSQFIFIPLVSPFTRYPIGYIKCGGRPIEAERSVKNNTFVLPEDMEFYRIDIFTTDYFCSETEARTNGFIRKPYLKN